MHRVTELDELDWELEQADPLVPKKASPLAVQLAKMAGENVAATITSAQLDAVQLSNPVEFRMSIVELDFWQR
jgi:hypothetical protein